MATKIIMPALGMAQETGILIAWLKDEGALVKAGEPLLEVETDKASVELESPASGILTGIKAKAGDEVPVAQIIGWILEPGEKIPPDELITAVTENENQGEGEKANIAEKQINKIESISPVAARMALEHGVSVNQLGIDGRRITKKDVEEFLINVEKMPRLHPASPKARWLASQHSLDISRLQGSGPDGAVLFADVLGLVTSKESLDVGVDHEMIAVSSIWKRMATRISQSWAETPHFYLVREINASRLIAWRTAYQKKRQEKITFTDLLIKLVAVTLQSHPRVNASWIGGEIVGNINRNIGFAVAIEEGLVVPVIHQADKLTLHSISLKRSELIDKANQKKLRPDDLQQGTFTISNLGMYNIDSFNAIINPPQVAILAVGSIAERVVPLEGIPVVQPMVTLTLSCDHRVIDGARGAEFLDDLATLISEPLGLID